MRQKMAIITSYSGEDNYGLLGPQLAATVIEDNAPFECIVVRVSREEEKETIKKALGVYFGTQRPIVGFSTLCGREDLFELAKELKEEGALTILGGPQAGVDFSGEAGKEKGEHRFQGFHSHFSLAVHGPAEQVLPVLADPESCLVDPPPGVLVKGEGGAVVRRVSQEWNPAFFYRVRWDNLYRVEGGDLKPVRVEAAQVLQQIGCPYALTAREISVDYPYYLNSGRSLPITSRGCSFCDVATDKGYYGALPMETVLAQIESLPEVEGVKIPFELINENPLPGLPRLLEEVRRRGLRLSRVDLVLRADWLCQHATKAREAVGLAREMGTVIRVSSVGFEAFDDRILRNLNKGTRVKDNLDAVKLLREIKMDFPENWAYASYEGSVHGFIHPTPWDTEDSMAGMEWIFAVYGLADDILPEHSLPLIIHHGCPLGEWARRLEETEGVKLPRVGTIIAWWETL